MQGVLNINPGLIKDVDTCIIYIKWKNCMPITHIEVTVTGNC